MAGRNKVRLDLALVEKGLVETVEAGRREILAGNVRVNEMREDKPGTVVPADAEIQLISSRPKFASRGGEKLERALEVFEIDLASAIAIDIGASTGGFTDCMLRRGAKRVYCVDVGYGQLSWKLRQDPRVVVYERTNARYITPDMFDPRPSFGTCDVSFISLSMILPSLAGVLADDAECVCLIKPQFEARRDQVGAKGVVRDPAVHREVIVAVWEYARATGFECLGVTASPIKGPEGNIEFLIYLGKGDSCADRGASQHEFAELAGVAVEEAHLCLD